MSIPVQAQNDNLLDSSDQQLQSHPPAPLSENYINRLVPVALGSTVSWYKKQTFSFDQTYNPESEIATYLSLQLDVYAYICNARPDETFEDQGGELYVIVVQRGNITNRGKMKMTQVLLEIAISGMESVYVSPKDQPDLDVIDFAETKSMFKDGGNATFEANLQYQNDCTRNKYRQYVETRPTIQYWSMEVDNTVGGLPIPDRDPNPFFGLSAFRSTRNLPTLNIDHQVSVRYRIDKPTGYLARDASKMNLNFVYKPPGHGSGHD